VPAGVLPVSVGLPAEAVGLARVQVGALPASVAERLSPFGVAVRLRAGEGAALGAPLSLQLDLAAADLASGGESSQRLEVSRLTGRRDVTDRDGGDAGGVVCDGVQAFRRIPRPEGICQVQASHNLERVAMSFDDDTWCPTVAWRSRRCWRGGSASPSLVGRLAISVGVRVTRRSAASAVSSTLSRTLWRRSRG
jgi:hypothetical protein